MDSVRTRNDIGNINSVIRDKHLKDFLYYIQNSFDQGYHLMETLRRMTIFVIGTFGVLILVLMEGDY